MTGKIQGGLQVCWQCRLESAWFSPALQLELKFVCVKKVSLQDTR